MTGARDTVLDYADLFSVTLRDDNVQEFDTRWDKVLCPMTKNPSDEIMESLYKLRIRESDQLKSVWNCTTWIFIRETESRLSKVEHHGEEESRSEIPFTKLKIQVKLPHQRSANA